MTFWKVFSYLNKLRKEESGFDFRIHLDNDDTPDGIVWMTLTMKRMLLQYGDILFLDAQKRQYNKMGWPYIGLVITTNESCVRYVAESIVIKEHTAMYKWVI